MDVFVIFFHELRKKQKNGNPIHEFQLKKAKENKSGYNMTAFDIVKQF